ncbi:hypothetical protein ACFL1H_08125 [Nanoarchaeota archaeon]
MAKMKSAREIAYSPSIHGILIVNQPNIDYLDFNTKLYYESIMPEDDVINIVKSHQGTVFYDRTLNLDDRPNRYRIKNIDGFVSENRKWSIMDVVEINNEIYDVGHYGMYKTYTNECIFDKKNMEERGYNCIKSVVQYKDMILALMVNEHSLNLRSIGEADELAGDHHLVRLTIKDNKFYIGGSVQTYINNNYQYHGRAIAIPNKEYPHYSIITNCNEKLTLNEDAIDKIDYGVGDIILVNQNEMYVDVILGNDSDTLKINKIDLEKNKKVEEKFVNRVWGLSCECIAPVTDIKLHNRLLRIGSLIKDSDKWSETHKFA